MTGEAVALIGSGRTDAGVHAVAQVANFTTGSTIPVDGFLRGLNSLLPEDIAVTAAEEVPLSFHARRDALGKIYRYKIVVSQVPLPLHARGAWMVRQPLDLKAMREAARLVEGTHDFSAFMGSGSDVATTVRTVTECRVAQLQPSLCLGETAVLEVKVAANGFLRYMVRNIVGLLVEIGEGRRPPSQAAEVLASRDRSRAGRTAPPQGLYLWRVLY